MTLNKPLLSTSCSWSLAEHRSIQGSPKKPRLVAGPSASSTLMPKKWSISCAHLRLGCPTPPLAKDALYLFKPLWRLIWPRYLNLDSVQIEIIVAHSKSASTVNNFFNWLYTGYRPDGDLHLRHTFEYDISSFA